MTSGPRQIAAEQTRRQIPTHWQIEFHDWTNSALASASSDARGRPANRAYAQWELDYREAFGVLVDYDPAGILRRRTLTTDAEWTAADQELTLEEAAAAARLATWRAAHTEEAIAARVNRDYWAAVARGEVDAG